MRETDTSSGSGSAAADGTSAAAPARADEVTDGEAVPAEALQAELAKWRERVPKLASALKARTDEVERLKVALDEAARQPSGATAPVASPAIEARDELIAELETKVAALSTRYQEAEGQLHARDLQIASLREEAQEWRDKWQSVTESLDHQSDSAGEKDKEVARLQRELQTLRDERSRQDARLREQDLEITGLKERSQSLESRNQNLFETTELANRQIETLGGNLEHLRGELKRQKGEFARKAAALAARDREIGELKARLDGQGESMTRARDEREAEVAGLTARLAELDAVNASLKETITGLEADGGQASAFDADEASPGEKLEHLKDTIDEYTREIARLEECVARAEETSSQWESERRHLSEQLRELNRRNDHLEVQLAERSDLVMGLENEKRSITADTTSLEAENQRLTEALEKAERSAAENGDHIAHLDDRLDRQKQLMDDLEQEYANIQEEYAEAEKRFQREMAESRASVAAREEDRARNSAQADRDRIARLEKMVEDAGSKRREAEQRAAEMEQRVEAYAREVDDREMAELAEDGGQNAELQAEVLKLEQLLRERTEALNELRWQKDMADRHPPEGSDSKMLVILNQQLASAREDNQRLLVRIRELEARHLDGGDDLTRIKGIGRKLVGQLHELGITRFEEIAAIEEDALDDENHPLHVLKGRIVKDRWITQAARLKPTP